MTPPQAKHGLQPYSHPDIEGSGWAEAMSGYAFA